MRVECSWKTAFIVFILVIVVATGAWFGWRHYKATQKTVEQLQEEIRQVHLEAAQRIESIQKDLQSASREAREAGDVRVKEIVSASDAEFLDALNEYSAIMVERVERGMEED
jgi:predicted negative regulator of RcsB-dependent stress response